MVYDNLMKNFIVMKYWFHWKICIKCVVDVAFYSLNQRDNLMAMIINGPNCGQEAFGVSQWLLLENFLNIYLSSMILENARGKLYFKFHGNTRNKYLA